MSGTIQFFGRGGHAATATRPWLRTLVWLQLLWLPLVLAGLSGDTTSAATTRTVFGPETFARGKGSPTAYTRTFAVDRLDGAFALVIENGDLATGADRVTSALVRLNGIAVAVPNDFKKTVAVIERTVDLARQNTLYVELRGKPGTYITIRVVADYPNQPPVANAGPDQTARVGDTVTLDGSTSSDPDGDPLTFDWSFLSWPTDSAAFLSDPTAVNPTFTLDRFGDYEIALTVSDGLTDSAPDSVRVSTLNSPPVSPTLAPIRPARSATSSP